MEVGWTLETLKGRCVGPFMCSFHHWLEEGVIAQVNKHFFVMKPPIHLLNFTSQTGDIKKTNNNTINGALSTGGMGNGTSAVEVSENNLVAFYESYCGNTEDRIEDAITTDGILHLCADLDLAADDFRILLFAWKCDAAQMGKLSKNEFLQVTTLTNNLFKKLKLMCNHLSRDVDY